MATKRGGVPKFIDSLFTGPKCEACIEWPFSRTNKGYGDLTIDGRRHYAHRVICERANGPPPTPAHEAAHSCGHGHLGCINPEHLRWATTAENSEDARKHGTRVSGEKSGRSKLTADEVAEIHRLSGTMSQRKIAAKFSVQQPMISRILSGANWQNSS